MQDSLDAIISAWHESGAVKGISFKYDIAARNKIREQIETTELPRNVMFNRVIITSLGQDVFNEAGIKNRYVYRQYYIRRTFTQKIGQVKEYTIIAECCIEEYDTVLEWLHGYIRFHVLDKYDMVVASSNSVSLTSMIEYIACISKVKIAMSISFCLADDIVRSIDIPRSVFEYMVEAFITEAHRSGFEIVLTDTISCSGYNPRVYKCGSRKNSFKYPYIGPIYYNWATRPKNENMSVRPKYTHEESLEIMMKLIQED